MAGDNGKTYDDFEEKKSVNPLLLFRAKLWFFLINEGDENDIYIFRNSENVTHKNFLGKPTWRYMLSKWENHLNEEIYL
jgi:hypothetical protein